MGIFNKKNTDKAVYTSSIKDYVNKGKEFMVNVKDTTVNATKTFSGKKQVDLITDHNEKVTHILVGMDNEITSINSRLTNLESKIKVLEKEKTVRKSFYIIVAFSIIIINTLITLILIYKL